MRRARVRTAISALCTGILMQLLFASASLANDCEQWVAKAVSIQGVVQAKRTGETQWTPVKLNDTFCPGDMLRVQERSRAAVVLVNETVARLDQKTSITFTGVEDKKASLIDLIKGIAHFFSRVPRSLKITTPFVNGAVEGTEFFVRVDPDQTLVSVFRGRVLASNDAGNLSLSSNQSALTKAGKAPEAYVVAHPRDAVRWAIYYPAVIDYRAEEFKGEAGWQGNVRKSIRFYREGDLTNAFSSLEGAPASIRDPRFYTYRAGLLLTVGRVDEAGADIEKALSLDSSNSHAFALKSIIAVSRNKKAEALELATEAVAQDPISSAAKIALSYAQQADFNMHASLLSLQEAVVLSPKNALAWARLSEMWLSVGDLDKALEAAQKAASLNPNLARTQTVLGYAYLAQIKTGESKAAFEKAIELDSAAPLQRLGLGLAKIREGDLKPGRAEIEIAAGLDPNNSLIRSYLGKAFFDEKRDKHADNQLAVAKELDPQDPTPWFYDAIRKQTINRPIEALHDLQKSIELNDNRAVYRSRLLLDEDLAARSASLGRVYSALGFEQLALVEGWKSVNTDPSSYSAHRFLADSYAARPRHEIARVSELLQSQLLQPLNITPVQPSLAEANTFILEGAGSATPSFNEFNPLFLRNRLALQTSGVVGGNDIYGDEIVHSGVCGRMSYSIGQFHYQTDGFRKNNDLDRDIYNVLVQTSLSHKASVQTEYRYRNTDNGDLNINFDPEDFISGWREEEKINSIRVGSRYAFTPHSDFLASFIYQDGDVGNDWPLVIEFEGDIDTYSGEIQHLLRLENFNLTCGTGYIKTEYDATITSSVSFPETTIIKNDIDHTNVYVYSLINYPENFTWTLGASADFYEGGLKDRDQFNPKFGITWNPAPATTIRGGIFRTLMREHPSNQTLEPTQVAGFNQFFDDAGGTKTWVYGVGIDQRFSKVVYGGLEYVWRELEFPFEYVSLPPNPPISEIRTADWEDDLARCYLYWTPHRFLTLSAEYQFEKLDREFEAPGHGNEVELETHKFPLGIGLYCPLGFNARIKATYVDQDGKFRKAFPSPVFYDVEPGDDQFWVVDASIGYRLPKRWGLITLEVKNLFDEEFKYQDTDPTNPRISPESLILARFALSF